ncbi:putative lipoprotein NlpE involved in copper resistance [Cytobacillus eiseniae]|uniref:Lipoprotein NlpE involved in copper resistance n=1 Tax=Cytobacillus eiseniae TaxID=762947 RepID=A0ABS4R9S2_9BACI|nr:hypothetical protein [Cytobacillus eiseniae]MBP2239632.1 putative lipoprotein NlpE involved in copper resistance [Cytobacillus eiseniae]
MKGIKAILALVGVCFLLIGCNNDANDKNSFSKMNPKNKQLEYNIIASEKTLPTSFHQIAFERKTSPFFQYLVRKIVHHKEFVETWNLFGFENKVVNVDFKESDAFFIGIQESGSCPYNIGNIELNSDDKTMTVTLTEQDGACTADATPRTFVIQMEKEEVRDIENVTIIQSDMETSIPLDNN